MHGPILRVDEPTVSKVFQAELIDGKGAAAEITDQVKSTVADLKLRIGVVPGLAVILVGDDAASGIYVTSKRKKALEVGMESYEHRLPASTTLQELTGLICRLNQDTRIHGILVQLPLPSHLDVNVVIHAIAPEKDVDGFHVINAGNLAVGAPALVPCTPLGCMMLLKRTLGDDLSGLDAVVIGKSNIVGRPMAQLLLNADCTVSIAHIKTRKLAELCRNADILVVAAGSPGLVRGDWIKPGATVIDVGINRVRHGRQQRLVGDVAFAEAGHARAITPVPGGVGPMTIACLLSNTLKAFRQQLKLDAVAVENMGAAHART